ncbi:NAD(P)-dependent alcohol dehydrogenase [Microbacterium sp. SSW1-59]|uniref:NAD(P)-dependent alcohol dehydrogenase n=1 Tax=Microbacterium xanthum TaxID=3079794 RepID=UPI002AD466CA|nr:NAD(P)-dependent alcohol dehydrogenase [Microbacterium sp. SSW1-59]MDZ8201020.1 NAD(P)-dependent alcohol dehydrogenase [Microbacterium sp. SSW1-59]
MNVPETMSAWVQRAYGEVDAVSHRQVPTPRPGAGEVLLRVGAAAINNGDVRIMRGEPWLVRLAFGIRRPKQPVRGIAVAGTVVAAGPDVTAFAVGDEVVGELGGGGLADYAVATADRLVPRPEAVSVVDAASLPVAAVTASLALDAAGAPLIDDAPPPEGGADSREGRGVRRVLVIGASGGVGSFAVKLAAARGAEVWALCGERNRAVVEEWGASRSFDYRRVQPGSAQLGGDFDAVLDIAGTASLSALRALVRDGGVVVLVSGEGGRLLGPIPRILAAAVRSIGARRPLRPLAAGAHPEIIGQMLELVADGTLRPHIERTVSADGADRALAHVAAGHAVGKTVVVATRPS